MQLAPERPLPRTRPSPTAVGATPGEPRTGSALNQALRPFVQEDRRKSWRLLTLALVTWAALLVATLLVPAALWPLKIGLGLLTGFALFRPFIVYHDHLHGAVLHDSKLGSALLSGVGLYMLTPRSVWRETHNHHHKHNAKVTAASIGALPVVTVEMWQAMSRLERFAYRAQRHPLVIGPAYVTFFLFGMSIMPFALKSADTKTRHWSGLLAVLLHVGWLALLATTLGPLTMFAAGILPLLVPHALGAYMFYAQHNFPSMVVREDEDWDYTVAALRSSSFFKMSRFMHWVTGNIGFHHVHHLSHRIPFYRLPEAMAAIPELQSPGTTSWRPKDIRANFRLAVWSKSLNRMLTWRELARWQGPDALV
ncbi:MAG: fatty acid desaturase [Myxococcota bacterium]